MQDRLSVILFVFRSPRIYKQEVHITWDEPKRRANLVKHGFDLAEFETNFDFEQFGVVAAKPGRDRHPRQMLVGDWKQETIVAAIVQPLGLEALSVISIRRASKKERRAYERI